MSESPDSTIKKELPMDRLNEELRQKYEHRRQDIKIPEGLGKKILEGINFSFSSGAAKTIDGHDLFHVHLCIPQRKVIWGTPDYGGWKGEPEAVLEKFGDDPDTVLLFHSQEYVNNSSKNRNIVIEGRNGKPRIIPSTQGTNGINPIELKTFSPLSLHFIATPDGQYTMDNGTKIDIFFYDFGKK